DRHARRLGLLRRLGELDLAAGRGRRGLRGEPLGLLVRLALGFGGVGDPLGFLVGLALGFGGVGDLLGFLVRLALGLGGVGDLLRLLVGLALGIGGGGLVRLALLVGRLRRGVFLGLALVGELLLLAREPRDLVLELGRDLRRLLDRLDER